MQKITVRTFLRALAMSPAVALGWVWGRGRAKAQPAAAADPLTVDASGVTIKGQLNADKVVLPGLKLEGTRGRNLFLDNKENHENADLGAGLRVGSAWGVNGIYSEMGPVVAGSADDSIWLRGGVVIRGGATAPGKVPEGTLTLPGVEIAGAAGRNFFLDKDKTNALGKGLRVGAESGVNGIYSEEGPVVVGSKSNNIWLKGGVSVGTEEAGKIPADVPDGSIRAKSIGFGPENLRIIRGTIDVVNNERRIIYGKGFKLRDKTELTPAGYFDITFDDQFSGGATATATAYATRKPDTPFYANVLKVSDMSMAVVTGDAKNQKDMDVAFSFIAIGPA